MSDKNIYDAIAKQYYKMIYSYCMTDMQNDVAAKDCTQEVFFRLYVNRGKLKTFENIRAWLFRCADNVMKEYRRKNHFEVPASDEIDVPVEDSLLISTEIRQSIIEIVGQEDYDLLLNYYIAGTDRKLLADNLGISEFALRKRIQRIRDTLRKNL